MEMSGNMSEMGCQYEYMMRMAQPGVPCPDDKTLLTLWANHEYMMTDFKQTMSMCNGMEDMDSRMVSSYIITDDFYYGITANDE